MNLHDAVLFETELPSETSSPESIVGLGLQPDRICANTEIRAMLDRIIAVLPKQLRCVVYLYYTRGLCMKDIAGILHVNISRVSQIHKVALGKMRAEFNALGIGSVRDVQ